MSISYLKYPLENGYVHNWLVVGPQATLVADLDRYTGADYKFRSHATTTSLRPGSASRRPRGGR